MVEVFFEMMEVIDDLDSVITPKYAGGVMIDEADASSLVDLYTQHMGLRPW